MEIYHDILLGLERESKTNKPVKRTRVQLYSNLSYDKFSRHLNDMAARGLVVLRPLSITQKGREFVRDYNRIRAFMREIGARFFEAEPPLRPVASELVAGLPSMRHSVLLYEDRTYADLVAARFLSEGLARGESCVYLTVEDPKIVSRKLTDLGVDVQTSARENRLRIYPGDATVQKRAASFEGVREIVEDSTKGMKPPFRIFGNSHQITRARGHPSQLLVEKLVHEKFGLLNVTMLCLYDLSKLPRSAKRKFVEGIIRRHNHVIYASDPSMAFGFDSSLLRTED